MDLDTFYWAVQDGDLKTVRRGLEARLDVKVKRSWEFRFNQTSLHVASRYGKTEVVKLLIESGAELDARDMYEYTPLHLAAADGHTGTCKLLIRSGADVKARNKNQSTPLHWAAAGGHAGTCKLLIRSSADLKATNKSGQTPFDRARDQKTRRLLKNAIQKEEQEETYHELLQQSGGVKVNRFKVFLGGTETTGKSTLRKSLKKGRLLALTQKLLCRSVNERYHPTPGVDIETFHVPGVGEVSIWDFAGHSEYTVTHSMFMDAENTVFIVLYNIMDDSDTQEKQVHWWLCFIKSCNRNRCPDVILVASRADLMEPATGQRRAARVVQAMKSEFEDRLRIADEVIMMDCRKAGTPEMDQLKSLLLRIQEGLLQHQRDMPKLCAKIMKRQPKWSKTNPKHPVMIWSDYLDEVKKLDRLATEDFLKKSTRHLHNVGELLFITPKNADPIIVLRPNWLGTNIFGPIMAPDNFPIDHRLRTPRNYVTRAEIQRVFQDVADVDLLITLLQEFQLCHSFGGQEFVFPGLLTQTMPHDKWQLTQEPKVIYFGKQVQCADSTAMFSSGFFPRVQTRLMRELQNRPSLWRNGAKCADRNVEGLIKLSQDGRAVNICVRSAQGNKVQCDKMLQQLENIIADVLYECSPGTSTVENVLSARALKEHREEFYSYGKEEIKRAWEAGGTIHHPTLAFEEYVSDLLCREDEDPLTRNRAELVQILWPVEPILDCLLSRDVLNDEECNRIRAKATPHNKARELLDTIGRKGVRASREFTAVLKEVNPYAAEVQEGTSHLKCREDEDPLTGKRTELIQALKNVEPILDRLLSRDILSEEECESIKTNRSYHAKARELLDIVRRKSKAARGVFKEVLEEVNPYAADLLQLRNSRLNNPELTFDESYFVVDVNI